MWPYRILLCIHGSIVFCCARVSIDMEEANEDAAALVGISMIRHVRESVLGRNGMDVTGKKGAVQFAKEMRVNHKFPGPRSKSDFSTIFLKSV